MKVGDLVRIKKKLLHLGSPVSVYGLVLSFEERKPGQKKIGPYAWRYKINLLRLREERPHETLVYKNDIIEVISQMNQDHGDRP